MLAYGRRVDFIGQSETGVDSNTRVAGLDVLFHKKFECELRNLDSIERNRIDVHKALMTGAVGVGHNRDIMHAAKNAEQRIPIVLARLDLIKINTSFTGNEAVLALQLQ